MRVGRPVKALPQPVCDYCQAHAILLRYGEADYPYRDDHGPLWACMPCRAWIGVFARSRRNVPLGRLANATLRELKAKLHAALEPLVQAKMRRDGCSAFEARGRGYQWLAQQMHIEAKLCTPHLLDDAQCQQALEIIGRFVEASRAGHATAKPLPAEPD